MNVRLLLSLYAICTLSVCAPAQDTVRTFLPELFSDMPYVRDLAIAPDGNEMYFTVDDYRHQIGFIVKVEQKRRGWSDPEVVSFSGRYRDIEPFLSEDGLRMYFASNRPYEGESDPKDYDIYYVERKKMKRDWESPVRLQAPVNTPGDEFYPSVAASGNLYFTSERQGTTGREDIFIAEKNGRHYRTPVPVRGKLNTESWEFNAWVAPDESYMIFTSYRERDGSNRSDLFISKRGADGLWQDAQPLNSTFSDALDYCPFVYNGTLYFTSERSTVRDAYDERMSFDQFMKLLKTRPNGLGRIYSIDLEKVLLSVLPNEQLR